VATFTATPEVDRVRAAVHGGPRPGQRWRRRQARFAGGLRPARLDSREGPPCWRRRGRRSVPAHRDGFSIARRAG